jgi:hypothetical protein
MQHDLWESDIETLGIMAQTGQPLRFDVAHRWNCGGVRAPITLHRIAALDVWGLIRETGGHEGVETWQWELTDDGRKLAGKNRSRPAKKDAKAA